MKKQPKLKIALIVLFIIGGCSFFGYLRHYTKANILQAYKVPAGSMIPTLMIGDCFLADKSVKDVDDVKRGDIVVFAYPDDPRKDYVKRVIGLPGDVIEIRSKQVFINGIQYEEAYTTYADEHTLPESIAARDNMKPINIPENALFVMGDNRDLSNDSRFWGFVPESHLKGRASVIYWSWDRKNSKVRWDRIGMACR